MLEPHSTADGQLLSAALTSDLAFEILDLLKSDGITTGELMGKLPGNPHRKAVCACLNRMQGAGLLIRIRTDITSESWLNRMGIAEAGVRLTEIAATLPVRSLEKIFTVSRQNAVVSRLTKFFSIPYRRDILQTLRRCPATPGEIFRNISPHVGLPAITVSLRTLEEFGLVSGTIKLINKELGGFIVKQYNITPEGTAMLDAFEGDDNG